MGNVFMEMHVELKYKKKIDTNIRIIRYGSGICI